MGPEHTVSFKDDQYVLALFIETPCQLLGPGTPRLGGQASQYNLRDFDINSLIYSSVYIILLRGAEDLGASHYHPWARKTCPGQTEDKLGMKVQKPLSRVGQCGTAGSLPAGDRPGVYWGWGAEGGRRLQGGLGLALLACSWRCSAGRGCLCSGPESFLSSSVQSH